MKHRAKKTRRQVRCTLCTPFRWMGNAKGRWPHRDRNQKAATFSER